MSVCNCSDGTTVTSNLDFGTCPDGCWPAYTEEGGEGTGRNLNGEHKGFGGMFKGILEGWGLIGDGADGPGEKNENCKKLKEWTGLDLCKYLKFVLIVIAIIILINVVIVVKKLF